MPVKHHFQNRLHSSVDLVMVFDVDEFYQVVILFSCEDENRRFLDVNSAESLEAVPKWFAVMGFFRDLLDLLYQIIIKRPIFLADFSNLDFDLLAHCKLIRRHPPSFPQWIVSDHRNLRIR